MKRDMECCCKVESPATSSTPYSMRLPHPSLAWIPVCFCVHLGCPPSNLSCHSWKMGLARNQKGCEFFLFSQLTQLTYYIENSENSTFVALRDRGTYYCCRQQTYIFSCRTSIIGVLCPSQISLWTWCAVTHAYTYLFTWEISFLFIFSLIDGCWNDWERSACCGVGAGGADVTDAKSAWETGCLEESRQEKSIIEIPCKYMWLFNPRYIKYTDFTSFLTFFFASSAFFIVSTCRYSLNTLARNWNFSLQWHPI